MRWTIRLIFWFFCIEWLLLFRIYFSPQALLCMALAGMARGLVQFFLVPTWETYLFFLCITPVLWLAHFCVALSPKGQMRRETLSIEFGIPWLAGVVKSRFLAIWAAEPFLGWAVFNFLIMQPGNTLMADPVLIVPYLAQRLAHDNPILRAAVAYGGWISAHAADMALTLPMVSLGMLLFYTLWERSRLSVSRPRRAKAASAFPLVEEHRHAMPGLPSVKQLVDELEAVRELRG